MEQVGKKVIEYIFVNCMLLCWQSYYKQYSSFIHSETSEIHPAPLQTIHGGWALCVRWLLSLCLLYIWMGLDRNVQPHECQLSESWVKEQDSLVVSKQTIEIEPREMRRYKAGEMSRKRCAIGGQVWKIRSDRDRAWRWSKWRTGDARCTSLARLSWPFLNHHLLVFKHILSFNT